LGDNSSIEWTDATWNPVVGCRKVSAGCDHCYAERLVNGRMRNRYPAGFDTVVLHHDRLEQPLRWRRPRKVFVNSLSDVFEEQVPDAFIVQLFAVMAIAERHTFQVLTKRPGRTVSLLNGRCDCRGGHAPGIHFRSQVQYQTHLLGREINLMERWPLPNVWLGTSVENQRWADVRIPKLLEAPAAVRFLSCEPLLGPIDISPWLPCHCPEGPASMPAGCAECAHPANARPSPSDATPIDWVIVGGESGPGARPMHPDWARSLRDQCVAAHVPFLFKQWGEHRWVASARYDAETRCRVDGPSVPERVGKSAAGRELEGRNWDQFPTPSEAWS
jgi:protein gp37